MKESYGSSIAVHAGNVWIKHGSVTSMNVLDGYRLSEFPDPGVIGKDSGLTGWNFVVLDRPASLSLSPFAMGVVRCRQGHACGISEK